MFYVTSSAVLWGPFAGLIFLSANNDVNVTLIGSRS